MFSEFRFLDLKNTFLPGFLRISFFPVFFRRNFFTGAWFGRGLVNSCFQPLSQDFFAGIPAG
jgi:hypothetical protein